MPQYQWRIKGLTRDTTTDVVSEIHWECICTEDGRQESFIGSMSLQPIDPQDPAFIPWASITESQAVAWLHTVMEDPIHAQHGQSKAQIEESLYVRLQERIRPRVVVSLPW